MSGSQSGIFKLKGVIKTYDWGGKEFLSELLSQPNPEKQPMAEYWLGAHGIDSSIIFSEAKEIRLNLFVAAEREAILGKTIAKKFGGLPYLLKLLDVGDMLSIQVHPAKHEAEIEFARENKERIPLDSPQRNYRDDNHKPEFLVALNEFWLLHGFKPVAQLRTTLEAIPELKQLLDIFNSTGYDQLYKTAMEMPQETVNQVLQPLLGRIIPLYRNGQLRKDDESFWAARAALTFNREPSSSGLPTTNSQALVMDRGIFSIYFFNLLHLKKDEGVFQDAGIPHSYLEGQGVEIMANSDNVLRGGLTRKHVDVKELMKHVKFEETIPRIVRPQRINEQEELYRTAAPDFKLSCFKLKKSDTASFESATAEILLVTRGNVSINSPPEQLEIKRGEAVFIIAHRHISLRASEDADVYRASVPVHSSE